MSEDVGLLEAVSLAVGGMIGGGIFAVLGVVAAGAGTAAWLAFVLAGAIALCAGYSFVRLNGLCPGAQSPIAQIEALTGERALAGMTGWLLTFGYVGTMAMYAHALGSYGAELLGLHAVAGVAVRPLLSVAAVGLFGALAVAGAHATGRVEDILVGAKVVILLGFAGLGLSYGAAHGMLSSGLDAVDVGAATAAAMAFVAFEGWELLLFDVGSIRDSRTTVPRAIAIAVVATTVIYVLVAVVTTNLVPLETLRAHPETALAVAARPFLGETGFVLISVAAVLSTASALNATLFSAARLSAQVADTTSGLGGPSAEGGSTGSSGGSRRASASTHPPPSASGQTDDLSAYGSPTPTHRAGGDSPSPMRTVLVVGVLTAVFALYGSLEGVTAYASGSFMTIFGGVCLLAFRHRGDSLRSAVVPAVGALGSGAALVALVWHLHHTRPGVLVTVAVIWAVVLSVYWVPRR
ncbi:MAG: APC family permease [Halobacteriaceae archaeon]